MFRKRFGRGGGGHGRKAPDGSGFCGSGFGGRGFGRRSFFGGRGKHAGMAAQSPPCPDPRPACQACQTLCDAPPGTTCRILRLHGAGAIRRRLLDLGLRPDRDVVVLRSAPLFDPLELRVGDSFIVLRRREAAQIEVEHV